MVRALRGDRPEITPVWFMRQAGRSLPEYRALRATGTMLDACLSPELASEITMQPVRRHGVDAAVFFSDIIVPLHLVGVEVEIAAGRGPVFRNPVRTAGEIAALVR
ncbi:uroporphyrinogen decarboxylase family protein, partial [Microbacterium sp. 69-7]